MSKYVLTCVVIKIKVSHSRPTRVVRVALVWHSCRIRVALVSLCLTRLGLVSFASRPWYTRVVCVALVSLVSGTCVVKWTRSK